MNIGESMNTQKLRELVLAATQGDWKLMDLRVANVEKITIFSNADPEDYRVITRIKNTASRQPLSEEDCSNAAYIAAACPANILALLDSRADLLEALQTVQTLIHGGMDGTDDAIYKCVSAAITKAEAL